MNNATARDHDRDRETAKSRLGQSLLLPDLNFRIPMPAGVKPPGDAADCDRETAKGRLGQSLLLPDLNFRIPMPAGVKPPADAAERDGKQERGSSERNSPSKA
jgi:hypothetical protein